MLRQIVRLGLAAFALAIAAPAAADDPELPIPTAADFGARPVLSTPVLAPDGMHVAARGMIDGKNVLLMVDISTEQRRLNPISLPAGIQRPGLFQLRRRKRHRDRKSTRLNSSHQGLSRMPSSA